MWVIVCLGLWESELFRGGILEDRGKKLEVKTNRRTGRRDIVGHTVILKLAL